MVNEEEDFGIEKKVGIEIVAERWNEIKKIVKKI